MDPTDPSSSSTDINSGGGITSADQNPSNGIDLNSLLGGLIGSAGTAYAANQQSQASIAAAQAQAAAAATSSANPLVALFPNVSSTDWLLIGAGVLALALILRR